MATFLASFAARIPSYIDGGGVATILATAGSKGKAHSLRESQATLKGGFAFGEGLQS